MKDLGFDVFLRWEIFSTLEGEIYLIPYNEVMRQLKNPVLDQTSSVHVWERVTNQLEEDIEWMK